MENSAEENKLIALKLGESPKEKLTGNRTIRIKSDKKLVVEFPFDFTENTINTSNISIELRTTGKGGASVKGIQLGDERKILHFPQLTDSNKICILDAEATLDEITTDCIGEHEYMITCDGSTSEQGYTCEITDKIFIVQGLKHSAVSEFSGAPSGASAASSSASMGGYGGGGSAGTPGEWFRGIVKRTFDEKQTSEEEVKPLQTLAPKMFNQPVVQEEKVLSPEREPVLEEQPTSVLSPVQIVPEKPVAVQHYSWLKWTLLPFAFALIGALLLVKKRRNTVSP
ncbi:MAG TPA: hypothetical protein VJB06_01545, partial [archaeon]|nr:hypothetical protein [archaeon]